MAQAQRLTLETNSSNLFKRARYLTLAFCLGLVGCQSSQSVTQPADQVLAKQASGNLDIWPQIDVSVPQPDDIEVRIAKIMSTMTLEQKVAQMVQPEIRDVTVEDMRQYGFGSYLNGGGAFPNNDKYATPQDWVQLAEDMYQASVDDSLDGSSIPTMWGTDAVHGHNNVIGATIFPHNIGLGAANNPELIEQIAQSTAAEVMATGIDWVFAPTVAVVRDDRWGRTYEGYSEDPEIVKSYSSAIVKGLQGAFDDDFLGDQRVVATVKHFLGDGGTDKGVDQGNNLASEQNLFDIHAQGYVGGLTAGAQTVMASFNSWHGQKIHGHQYLLTEVLKKKMGFDGFVVGDWLGHGQVPGCTNDSCSATINAGLDVFMASGEHWKPLYHNTIAQVKSGEIPMDRINDAVSRILRVKIRAGLFEKPSPANRPLSGKTSLIGADSHRSIARQAVRESLVLLKNKSGLLPLKPKQRVLVAGDAADNIGKQSGGWTITWQGTGNTNEDFPGATSVYGGISEAVNKAGGSVELNVDGNYSQKPDVAIVVFGEEPYAEGNGDIQSLVYQAKSKSDLKILKKLKDDGIPVVAIFISGRPLWVNPELNASDAFVAAWLPGSEGAGISDVLFTDNQGRIQNDFKGKLSFSWPAKPDQTSLNRGQAELDKQALFAYGYGLQYGEQDTLTDDLPTDVVQASAQAQKLTLFERSVQAPFAINLSSNGSQTTMTSNVAEVGALKVRTIDKEVQEDARQLIFNGSSLAGFAFKSNEVQDLSGYDSQSVSLNLQLRVDQRPSEAVSVAMECGTDCSGSLDISEQLQSMPINQWQQLSIPLDCFVKAGADLERIDVPMAIRTSGTLGLSLGAMSIANSEPKSGCV